MNGKRDELDLSALTAPAAVPLSSQGAPPDFGRQGGAHIANRDSILPELDAFLGRKGPPSIEYLFVEPLANVRLPSGNVSGMNPFGHAAIRYTLPSGEQKLMNISGLAGHDMVNFFEPAEYLYGTKYEAGNEQRGVYNRSMIGLRIEAVAPDVLLKLDEYYNAVRERQRSGDARFHLALSRLVNTLDWLLPVALVEMGNCAAWTSGGLKHAGLIDWRSYYPKRIFVKLLEQTARREPPENWNVVSYQRIPHAADGHSREEIRGPVTPLHFFSSRKYLDLHSMDFVKATVSVAPGETIAKITAGPCRKSPTSKSK